MFHDQTRLEALLILQLDIKLSSKKTGYSKKILIKNVLLLCTKSLIL